MRLFIGRNVPYMKYSLFSCKINVQIRAMNVSGREISLSVVQYLSRPFPYCSLLIRNIGTFFKFKFKFKLNLLSRTLA